MVETCYIVLNKDRNIGEAIILGMNQFNAWEIFVNVEIRCDCYSR